MGPALIMVWKCKFWINETTLLLYVGCEKWIRFCVDSFPDSSIEILGIEGVYPTLKYQWLKENIKYNYLERKEITSTQIFYKALYERSNFSLNLPSVTACVEDWRSSVLCKWSTRTGNSRMLLSKILWVNEYVIGLYSQQKCNGSNLCWNSSSSGETITYHCALR